MRRRFLMVAAALASLPACSDSSTEFWRPRNDLLPMVALDSSLVFVEKNSATAFLLDPADASLVPKLMPVGKKPTYAIKHKGSDRLLVLSAGQRGSASQASVSPQLTIVDPQAETQLDPFPLATSFDILAQSDDGNFAILYHGPNGSSGDSLFDPNEMMVADFSANLAGAPTLGAKSIRSMGGVPARIVFSPVYAKNGIHRLAVVQSQNYLTVFDLLNPAQSEISLPLCLASASCNYSVEDVVFDPSNFKLYVRAAGAKDIFQVSLAESADGTNDLGASLSMLGVGGQSTDMVLYGTGKDARLAALSPENRRLVIINPDTSNSASVTLAIPASSIVPFTTPSQSSTSNKPRNQAMLVDRKQGSGSVLFVDFGSTEAATAGAPGQYAISGSASEVFRISSYDPLAATAAPNVAILRFGKSSGSVLSVVALDSRSFFDFSSGSSLDSSYLEIRPATASGRLWNVASPDDGVPGPSSGIYYRDLPAGAEAPPPTVWLDQTITGITPMADRDGLRYLILGHNDPTGFGNLTILDARNPDRATARTAYGFLFTKYLERGQP
jgi:hypothetical protein